MELKGTEDGSMKYKKITLHIEESTIQVEKIYFRNIWDFWYSRKDIPIGVSIEKGTKCNRKRSVLSMWKFHWVGRFCRDYN